MDNVTCETLAGECHGHATGSYPEKEFEMTFWHGEPISITRFEPNGYVDVIHLRGPWTRHGPEFTQWRTDYFSNRMWTHGSQTGDQMFYETEPNKEAPFFDERGKPRWEALYNWCDYVPDPPAQHARWGNICTYDPAVDSLTKTMRN